MSNSERTEKRVELLLLFNVRWEKMHSYFDFSRTTVRWRPVFSPRDGALLWLWIKTVTRAVANRPHADTPFFWADVIQLPSYPPPTFPQPSTPDSSSGLRDETVMMKPTARMKRCCHQIECCNFASQLQFGCTFIGLPFEVFIHIYFF